MKNLMKLDLQHFAESAGGTELPAGGQQTTQTTTPTQQSQSIDYDRLAQMVAGKQSATEESVLRGYFKNQGLSKEEADQAIEAFKQQKAASQPDVNALQTQAAQAQAAAQKAQIESAAVMEAVTLGIDSKTIPYVLKMADLSQVMGEDGKINNETLKNTLNKVLEDVPALKPAPAGQTGFVQVGASGSGQQTAIDDALKQAFGV